MTAIRLYVSVRLAGKSFTRMAPDMAPSAAQLRGRSLGPCCSAADRAAVSSAQMQHPGAAPPRARSVLIVCNGFAVQWSVVVLAA
jgi:hypothetical protein